MAKLRKWVAYRKIERPYTRFSKVRGKAFVKSKPGKTIVKYDMGNKSKMQSGFNATYYLVSKDDAQIRTNSIEAGRQAILKKLEAELGRDGFFFKIRCFSHHAIRENKLAAGAGADRLSTGMKHSFGKIIGTAVRAHIGKKLIEISLPKEKDEFVRRLMKIFSKKLPVRTTVEVEYREVKAQKKDD